VAVEALCRGKGRRYPNRGGVMPPSVRVLAFVLRPGVGLLLRFADVAALHTPRLSLINHLTSPLARAWQGHQARPRFAAPCSCSPSTPTAEQKIILAHGRVFARGWEEPARLVCEIFPQAALWKPFNGAGETHLWIPIMQACGKLSCIN
jgi:hypothetical protein